MKKLISIFALVALSMVMLCSCNDDNVVADPAPETEKAEDVDYVLMHYSLGGGNLDEGILTNIMQLLDEGSNEKVKMTFEYKLSDSLQHLPQYKDFEGTRRFTADQNTHFKDKFQSLTDDYPYLDGKKTADIVSQIKSERIGDAKYDMSCKEGLADFIKWSKQQYPNAKHMILVISDHGGAWNLFRDGKKDTRAVLFDDNIDDTQLGAKVKDKGLSLQNLVDGVNDAGGIDALYMDACLMSTYENLYGYAQCVKYLLASFETVSGYGADYRELNKLLKKAGSGEEDMVDALKKYVDYNNSDSWWNKDWPFCTDMGLYDLSKLNKLTPILKKIADTLAEKYVSNEELELKGEEHPLGNTYAPYIRSAMNSCLVSYVRFVPTDSIPQNIASLMLEDGVRVEYEVYLHSVDVIKWLRFAPTDNAKMAYEKYPEEWAKAKKVVYDLNYTSYSLTDLMGRLYDNLVRAGLSSDDNPFDKLLSDMLDALKDMAYIRCTKESEEEIAYLVCSPGVCLIPLNDLYYCEENKSMVKSIPTYQEALRYYQNTEFDKQVGWSRVLQLLDVYPNAFTNTMRDFKGELQVEDEEK